MSMKTTLQRPMATRLRPLPLAFALLASAAHAQTTASDGIETIVVTARYRAEPVQEVPIAVKAFSAAQIADAGIRSTQDFIDLTPNMSFDRSFTYRNSFVTIRGVAQINNADSPVAVVVDGVPQGNQKQLSMNLFDIERIEVLKGPQGALYGRNAIGGVINIETRAPKTRFESWFDARYGSGNTRELTAAVNGASAQGGATFRLAAQTRSADGMTTNAYLDRKVDAVDHDDTVRAKAAFLIGSGLRLDLHANVNDFAAGANWDSIVRSGNPNDIVVPQSNLLGKTNGNSTDFSIKAEFDTSFATLSAITGYTDLTERYRGDLDFSHPGDPRGGLLGPLPFQVGQGQNLSTRLLSQEIRFTSPTSGPLRWIAGAYYLKTERDLESRAFVDTDGSLAQWDDAAKTIVRIAERNDNRASAVFGQIDTDLAAGITLSGALRHDRDARTQTDVRSGTQRRDTFDAWQPKITLTRQLDRDRLVYATYGTGFRSGGFNAPGLPEFKPETLANLEVGWKSALPGNRLIFNAALFYSRSSDFQYFHVDAASASQVIANIDRVDIKGADIDFRYHPTKELEFDGGLGLADSRIRKNAVDPATVGNHSPKTVPLKVNIGLQYSKPVSTMVKGFVRLDLEHRGKKYWHPDNAAVSDALNLVHLRLGLRGAADKWSAHLVGRNLTDRKYYADYNAVRYSGGAVDIGSLAPPRTLGIEANIRFE
jgi:iron complex outermembrane receptor protein